MRITIHITFYYRISNEPGNGTGVNSNNTQRLAYLNRMIDEMNIYPHSTDIFIHSNTPQFTKELLHENKTGRTQIFYHDVSNEWRWNLAMKHRPYMEAQKDDYDVFIYSEDDILLRKETFDYWLEHKDHLNGQGYNVGFVRVEVDENGQEYTTDMGSSPCGTINRKMNKILKLGDKQYAINDINTYCGSWIYDKKEFHRFLQTKFWTITDWNPELWGPVERYTIGLNGNEMGWYKATLIALTSDKKVDPRSKLYHLPNNYINGAWKLFRFEEILEPNPMDCTGKQLVHKIIYPNGYRLPICEVVDC